MGRDEEEYRDKGPNVQDWSYALNGYQHKVSGSLSIVDGRTSEAVTVDVFKRYNWGNVAGGAPRDDVGPGLLIAQNDLARLNAEGIAQAQDYKPWGEYTADG